jgi:KUP system potassium uptake protein
MPGAPPEPVGRASSPSAGAGPVLSSPASAPARAAGPRHGQAPPAGRALAGLALGALGVVYGDIGTSPL